MSYIKIPKEEGANFRRTISRFESIEPVELSDGDFIIPTDILDRLNVLSEREDYKVTKAEYVTTLKTMLEEFDKVEASDIKDLLINEEIL